ncbi:hypothetical protein SAMN05444972_11830 [Marininema halotolerans]|uniref:Uncharacterized protein n=1 Tax=Marininema halotolerans TaxID=1155944 RepID=A0A1I6UMF0_9BACL|nr:hypothetical protein SAMN05444972_11830 [Marininema halotolerans]
MLFSNLRFFHNYEAPQLPGELVYMKHSIDFEPRLSANASILIDTLELTLDAV